MVVLAAAGWEAELLPPVGGAVASLRHRGVDILRPTPPGTTDPLEAASFALVPYANRIADGRFAFAGRAIELARNFRSEPHTLHGIGWQRPWEVAEAGPASATLTLVHRADQWWPWSFAAEQRLTLGAEGFSVVLTMRNDDAAAMPAGLGLHPYFPANEHTRLQAKLVGAWLSDATLLPVERVAPDHFGDWVQGDNVQRPALVDNCHDGWDGALRVEQADHTVLLTASGTRWLHLYMPPGAPYFCAEPVSHLPDAVNRPGQGIAVLAPGEATSIAMRIALA